MLKFTSSNSALALFSAAGLAASTAHADLPKLEAKLIPQGGTNSRILSVEHNRNQAGYVGELQFSSNLRQWASVSNLNGLQLTSSNIPTANTNRVRAEFRVNTSPTNAPLFFRTAFDILPNIVPAGGIDISPYIAPDENPSWGGSGQITVDELRQRIAHVAPYFTKARCFGTSPDLQPFGAITHELGLQAIVGAWISSDTAENDRQIAALKSIALAGQADMALVGSEAILRNDVSVSTLVNYINDVRQTLRSAGIMIPVATADVYGTFLNNPALINACDVVPANFYPYWEGHGISCALVYLNNSYTALQAAANGKQVIVSETGWSTAGAQLGSAIPSLDNSIQYLRGVVGWAKAKQVDCWLFSSNDQWSSAQSEGEVGAHWGIWDANLQLKPGMEAIFQDPQIPPTTWLTCAGETPTYDVFTSTNDITTNLRNFFVSGSTSPSNQVRINGVPLPNSATNSQGDFAAVVPLNIGSNNIVVEIYPDGAAQPSLATTKKVYCDPGYSTAGKRLLYVDLAPDGAPTLAGTVVINLEDKSFLGIIPDRRVVGISPGANPEIYFQDRGVLSCANHTETRQLQFSSTIDRNSFAVSPDGTKLVSKSEILDVASNTAHAAAANITTGGSYASAAIPGGPTFSPDGRYVYYGYPSSINRLNVASNVVENIGMNSSSAFLSDLTVSPDNRIVAVSAYGLVKFYDASSATQVGINYSFPDFNGEVVFTGQYAVVGGAGNPQNGGGGVFVINTNGYYVTSGLSVPLADNVTVNGHGQVITTAGDPGDGVTPPRFGVDIYQVTETGTIQRTESYCLGVNRWIRGYGRPQNDAVHGLICTP